MKRFFEVDWHYNRRADGSYSLFTFCKMGKGFSEKGLSGHRIKEHDWWRFTFSLNWSPTY